MSKSIGSTPSDDVNRNTSSDVDRKKSDSSVNFGEKVGRSEKIESDTGDLSRTSANRGSSSDVHGDSGRSSGSGLGSSSGRTGSSGIRDMDKKSDRGGSSNESL